MRYILSIPVFIFFVGCSGGGNVSDSTPKKEIVEKNTILETSEKKDEVVDNITTLPEKEKENENQEVEEKKTIFTSNEPYKNQFQPEAITDPNAPKYVEPPKEYLNGKELKTLSGEISQNMSLSNLYYWKISGDVKVKSGVFLKIEEGTTLFGENKNSTLSFEDGAELIAKGKKNSPIIFTSEFDILDRKPKAGDWGGITISGENESILRYVQIRYAGYNRPALKLENTTFKTLLEFLEIYISHSDGIEVSGEDVNLRNIIVLGANGDSLSLKNGWNGKMQNIYIHQFEGIFGEKSSGLDIGKNVQTTITNLAILSQSKDVGAGIYLRGETSLKLIDSIILGERKGACVKAEKLSTENHIFESDIFGNCLAGELLKVKVDKDLNIFASANLPLKDLAEKVEPINPYSLDSWFDNYPQLYIGPFNFNSTHNWSDGWSIGMEELLNEK